MYTTRTICTNGREKVPTGQTSESIFHFTAVASEEYCAISGTITNTQDITLLESWPERGYGKRKVVRSVATRVVGDGGTIETRKAEGGLWLGCQSKRDVGGFWEIENFHLPVVDFIEFW